jgi:hypothetical protein
MKKITLTNEEMLDALREGRDRPKSISDLLAERSLRESLLDNGITNFKEITDINKISFGHFILIEKILGIENIELREKVRILSPIILRPIGEEKLDNANLIAEEIHKAMIMEEPIGNIYGAFNRFMEIRKTYLYKTYNGVIYGALDEDEKDDEEKEEGISTNSGQSAREFHTKKFFWNSMISTVANGDIFKFGDAVELMMYVVMPFLAEKRSLGIVEYLEFKANNK